MTRRRFRGSAGQAVVSILGVVALASTGLAALFGAGSPARSLSLRDGASWVQSASGSLELVDTGSGVVGYRLSTPLAAAPLEIVGDGTSTVLRDPATGAIRSIDLSGAKAKLTAPADLAKEARLVSGSGRTFVLLPERGDVALLDPATLAVGPAINLGGPLGSAAVDGAGTLWVVVPGLGTVVPVNVDGSRMTLGSSAPVGHPGARIEVTVSAGAAYAVDRGRGELLRLAPGEALPVATVPPGALVASAQGEPADGHVVIGDPSGALLRIDPRTGRTARFELPGRVGHRLGAPMQSRNRVTVLDLTTGELLVLDPATGAREGVPLGGRRGEVPVIATDGAVVANDPASATAVVVTPAGEPRVVDKGGVAPGDDEPDLTPTPAVVPAPAVQPRPASPPAAQPGSGVAPAPAPRPVAAPGPQPAAPARPVVPSAVRNLQALPADASIDLSWGAAADGGSPLTGHRVECAPSRGAPRGVDVAGAATAATVSGLANGVDHQCTVVARNAAGAGPAATAPTVRPVHVLIGAAKNVSVATADSSLRVSWAAPDIQPAQVASYSVTATSAAGPTTTTVPGAQKTATIPGLVNGTAYQVVVRALEASGAAGPPSAAPGMFTPAGVPGAPQAVVATARSRAIDVRWLAAPANGSPVLGYTVKAGTISKDVAPADLAVALTGLANGTAYAVTVTAKNALGSGPASAPRSATPGGPEILTLNAVSAGGTDIDVQFDVDWKGETTQVCRIVVQADGSPGWDIRIPCGTPYRFNGGLYYDSDISITAFAQYGGLGETKRGPVVVRTPDAPIVLLTRSMNNSPRDWFYGRPEEGNRFALVQDSGVWVYTVPRPGTVPLQRFTDGRPTVHWYGIEGEAVPGGFRVETTLGYVLTAPGPGRSDLRRYTRTDFQGAGAGRDCFLPSAPAQYADLGPGGWTDEGHVAWGAPIP